jgi:disulfide bond formation protein DsbB
MSERFSLSVPVAALAVAIAGGATIAGAWGLELIAGLEPCPLCLQQRWPYYTGVPLAIAALALGRAGRTHAAGVALAALAAIMAVGAGLGVHHAGIEWGLWEGPSACSGGGTIPRDASGLLESLGEGRIPSCSEASWRLFGLSLAGYNALIAAALALIAASGARGALARRTGAHGSSSVSQ